MIISASLSPTDSSVKRLIPECARCHFEAYKRSDYAQMWVKKKAASDKKYAVQSACPAILSRLSVQSHLQSVAASWLISAGKAPVRFSSVKYVKRHNCLVTSVLHRILKFGRSHGRYTMLYYADLRRLCLRSKSA